MSPKNERQTVSVFGSAKLAAPSDVAQVSLGVATSGEDLQQVLDLANAAIEKVQQVLLAGGVAAVDLKSGNTSLWLEERQLDGVIQQVAKANLTLSVLVRNIDQVGTVVREALFAAGQYARLEGISYQLAETAELDSAAREAAFSDAKTKAKQYASLAGKELGQVVRISETDNQYSARPATRMMAMAEAGSSLALQAGESEVSASLSVEWELL